MKEFTADRWEDGFLVCFGKSGERLTFPCPAIRRPEGRKVAVFDSLGSGAPYVCAAGAIALSDGRSALIMPPDETALSRVRSRFDEIFKKST